jgi:hypothetical protein
MDEVTAAGGQVGNDEAAGGVTQQQAAYVPGDDWDAVLRQYRLAMDIFIASAPQSSQRPAE